MAGLHDQWADNKYENDITHDCNRLHCIPLWEVVLLGPNKVAGVGQKYRNQTDPNYSV